MTKSAKKSSKKSSSTVGSVAKLRARIAELECENEMLEERLRLIAIFADRLLQIEEAGDSRRAEATTDATKGSHGG